MVGKPRWRWFVASLLIGSGTLSIICFAGSAAAIPTHHRVWAAMAVCGLVGGGLILWWLLASRWSMGVRLGSAGAMVGSLSIVALGIQLHGLTLDGLPLLQRRGSIEAGTLLPQPHHDPWSDQRPHGERWPAATIDLLQPRRHWRLDVGAGFAGFAVARGLAITQEQRGVHECVVAYDLRLGSEIWAYGDTARFADLRAGVGPRATPAIDGDHVLALGATGWLRCLDVAGGQLLWRRQVRAPAAATALWSKPLVWGDLVIVTAGAETKLQAFDRLTGEPRWQADTPGGDGAPVLTVTASGLPLVVASGAAGASGHDPGSGLALWQASWPASGLVAPEAVPLGRGRLLLGGGPAGVRAYNVQWQIGTAGLTAALLWRTTQLRPALSVGVEADGFVFGLDEGRLVCIDAATGYRRWQGARYGHGRILRAGSQLLVQAEDGTVAIVVASAEGSHERFRFRALHTRRGWAEPMLHDRWLLVRDDDEAALWELPAAVE